VSSLDWLLHRSPFCLFAFFISLLKRLFFFRLYFSFCLSLLPFWPPLPRVLRFGVSSRVDFSLSPLVFHFGLFLISPHGGSGTLSLTFSAGFGTPGFQKIFPLRTLVYEFLLFSFFFFLGSFPFFGGDFTTLTFVRILCGCFTFPSLFRVSNFLIGVTPPCWLATVFLLGR